MSVFFQISDYLSCLNKIITLKSNITIAAAQLLRYSISMFTRKDFSNSFKGILDFVFPPVCSICGKTDSDSKYALLCDGCINEFKIIEEPFCTICGTPFISKEVENHPCSQCLKTRPYYNRSRSAGIYSGTLEDTIKTYKYKKVRSLFKPLSDFMFSRIEENFHEFSFDYVVPVPLSGKRLRNRGFHNAYLLAKTISEKRSIPVNFRNLIKFKDTKPQVELKFKERKTNILGSFKIMNTEMFKEKSILLIDDVYTTGNTLNECAKVLKKEGKAQRVECFTLAKTMIQN